MGNCLSSQSPAAAAAAKSDSTNSFKGSVRSPMGFSRQRIPAEFLDGFPSSSDMAYPVNNRGIATIVTQPKGEGRSMTLPGNKFSISFDDNLLGRKRISRGSNIDSAVDSSKERSQFQSAERLIGGRDASLVLSVQKSQTSIMSSSSGGVRRPHHRLASVSCSQLPLGKADKGSQTKQSVLLESRAESCGKIESNHTNAASCISSSRTKSSNKTIEDESKDESSSDLKNCGSVGTARPTTTTTTIGSQPLASPTINSSKANPTKDQEPPLPLHILKQTIKAQVNQSEAINQTQPSPGIKNNRSSQSFVGPEKSDPNGLDKSLNLKTSPILETNLDEDNVSIGLPQRVVTPLGTANSPPLLTSPKLVQNENLILSPNESQVSSNSSLGPLTRNDSFTRAIEEGSHKDTLKTTNPTSPVGSGGSSEGSLELDSDSTASWFEAGHIDSLDLDEFRSSLRRLSVLPEESEESEVQSSIASPVQTPEEDKGALLFTPSLQDPRRGSFKRNSSKSKPISHSLDHHLDENNKTKGTKRLSRHISDPLVLSGTLGAAKGLTLPEEGTLDKLSLPMKLVRSTSRPLVMTSNNSLQSNNTETAVPCCPSELEDIEEIDKDALSLPSSDDDEFKEFEEAFSSPKSPDALSSSIYESPLSSMMEYESPISSPSYYATPMGSSPWTSPQSSFKCLSPSSPSRKTMNITSSPFPEHQIPINAPDSFLNVPTLAVMSNCKRSQSLKVRPNGGLRPGRNLLQSSRAFDLGDGDVDDLPPSDISSSKPAQLGHPCASKNGENDPTTVKVASSEPPTNAKAVLMRRACSVPSEAHTNIGIPLLVHTQNLAQENVPGKVNPCAKPNEVRSPAIIQDKNPTNNSGSLEAAVLSKKPEDKPIRVASKQRAQGQENPEHFAPDGRRTADIVKDEKGQEATWPSSQIQGDCQSARKGSVRRPDKASQNEKNGEIQETKKKDERGKVQGKEVQTNQGQAPQLGDKEIGNQTDKYEPDLDSEGGSEKTMSSLAGSSFQRSVAFDLTISDERHSSSSSSSSSSDDGENGEHTREEQKVLEKVETPTKEGNNQVDQSHSLENKGDYCDKTTTINKSCTSDDKSEIAPTDHKEKVLEEPKPNDEDQTNMTNDEPSTSLSTTPTKPKGILKPSSNSEALRNSSFPSLPETFLLKLGVNLIPAESANFSTDNLSDQDIESKFTALSLAFNTDKLTLNDRLELQQRQRDTAEKNIDEDIRQLKTAIGSLNKVCTDAETREMLHRLQKQVDVLRHSSERVSSSAEVYGAVQQEARISRAIEIMLHHVDNLKRIYEREHAELQDAKKILADNNLSIAPSNSLLGASGGLSGDSGHNSSNKGNSNRGRSISVINPSGTAVTFGPGTNGASSDSPKLRRASVGVPPASALRSPNPNRRNVVESGQLFPSFQKAIRKQATAGPVRKTSTSGGLRMYGAEGRESGFSPISEHGEAISGGKFDDSFESRVAGQSVRNEAFRGDSNNNNNNHLANGDFLKKSDDFNSIPDYGARNRRSDRVRSTSLIEPVKEEEEDAILEEIDTLAMKRDSSPAPHSLRRVGELPWLSYLRTLRQYLRYLLEWYQEFTWPWDWDETILGVRYAITGVLLFAAFISLVFTFFGGGGGSVKVTDAT